MTARDDGATTTWERGAWLASAALLGATGLRTRRRAQRLQVLDDVTDDVAVGRTSPT